MFISFWIFTEPFRLAFGWTGNLRESVPNLFIFILLTVIPQTPAQVRGSRERVRVLMRGRFVGAGRLTEVRPRASAQIYLAAFQKDITAFDKVRFTRFVRASPVPGPPVPESPDAHHAHRRRSAPCP